ncbi:MAG: Rab family GTPase [Promethearchaeota archaeon]
MSTKTWLKIVLCGDGGVGKTTIAQKLTGTLDLSKNREMTVGIDFHHLKISEENLIHAQIWDLGGQTQFRDFQEKFFESAHVLILTFSVVRFPSFLNISSWLPLIKNENLIQTYLIANKIDSNPRVVSREDALKIAQQNNMRYFEISALTGENFNDFQEDLIESIKNALLPSQAKKQFLDISYKNGRTLEKE